MDEMTQQNASLVEEAAAASEAMGAQAQELSDLVSYFNLGSEEKTIVVDRVQRIEAEKPEPNAQAAVAGPAAVSLPQSPQEDGNEDGEWKDF